MELSQNWFSCYPFIFKKMTDRLPVKGNGVDSRPSFMAETLSWFLLRNLVRTFWKQRGRSQFLAI